MNVCIVASGDFFSDYGGGQVYVRNIVDEFARHSKISTTVISFNSKQQPTAKDYNGIQVYVVNNELSLLDALKSIKPDIVHANGEKLITSRLCRKLNIPCIVTAHHGGIVCPAGALLNSDDKICNTPAEFSHCIKCYLRNTPTGFFWYPLLKQYSQKRYIRIGERLKRLPFIPYLSPIGETGLIVCQKINEWQELAATATHFIAPSNAIAEALKRNGCSPSKITIIPHGIPITGINNNSQFSILNSQLIKFYYVGRINYIKGIHVMLQAFTEIDNNNIELHIIGDAANKDEVHYKEKLLRKYKKNRRIVWHGKVSYEQLDGIIKDFQCLIHPTICLEVFGLDISEALMHHKYIIATRCGGAEMQIQNAKHGVLVSPNNVDSLKNALLRYIDSPRMSECNVECISSHINKLLILYSKILSVY